MQTTEIRFVVLFLFLHSSVDALRECGEFDQNGIVAREIREYSEVLPFQNELEQLFDAFENNDTELMEAAYKLLENVENNDIEDYGKDLIKFVVRARFFFMIYS